MIRSTTRLRGSAQSRRSSSCSFRSIAASSARNSAYLRKRNPSTRTSEILRVRARKSSIRNNQPFYTYFPRQTGEGSTSNNENSFYGTAVHRLSRDVIVDSILEL